MLEITIPLTFEDLPTKPEIVGKPKITEDIQQTLALLSGWDESTRRLIRVSPTGALHVCSPKAKGVWNIAADTGTYKIQGDNIPTSEVLIKAWATNTGLVFVNIGAVAEAPIGYPLSAGEWISLSIDNLHSLHIYIHVTGEKAAVIYTR